MRTQRLLIALTAINFTLLICLLARSRPVQAVSGVSTLRARALEILDDRGRVRASIKVQTPDEKYRMPNGAPYPETVLLRLIDPHGRPNVKLGASELGAGLGLGGESDPTYVLIKAEGTDASLKLTNKEGREQLIKP